MKNRTVHLVLALGAVGLLAALLLALAAGPQPAAQADGDIIKVPDDYTTIQDAIDAAADGDTILVAAGFYFENLRITQPITLSGGWNITWTHQTSRTVVDGSQSGRVISITCATSDTVVTIDHFGIRNGDATGLAEPGMPELPRWGDAISQSLEAFLPGYTRTWTLDLAATGAPDSISQAEMAAELRADLAEVAARGLYPGGEAAYQAMLERLERRTAQAGEAKARANAPPARPAARLQQGEGSGGGIYSWRASPHLLNNTIYGNVATQDGTGWGGGVYVSYAAPGGVQIANNTIRGNVASYSGTGVGGGLALYVAPGAVIENNYLQSNWASGYGTGWGGGVSVYASPDVVFADNTTVLNAATLYGGGQGGGLHVFESPGTSIIENTVLLNAGSGFGEIEEGSGGGIYVVDSSGVIIEGNSISDNTGIDAGILALSTGGAGGLMVDSSTDTIVRDNLLEGNTGNAAWGAHAGTAGGLQIFMSDGARVISNTIRSNLAVLEGGGGGGAVLVSYSTDVLLTENKVTGNWGIMFAPSGPGSGGGGGIALFKVYHTSVSTNTIQENTAIVFRGGNAYGGGFFASAVGEGTQIAGNDIKANIACLDNEDGLAGGGGGYIGAASENAVVTGNTFEDNLAGLKALGNRGGGMLLRNTVGSQVLGNRFVDNVAGMGDDAHGGGLLLDSFFDTNRHATVDGNLFLNNRASADPDASLSSGGACHVWIVLDGFWFTNNVLVGNQATNTGGLWLESAEHAHVANNTLVDNADAGMFASVVTTHTTDVTFVNNVVVSQSVGVSVSPGATTTVRYNLWDAVTTEVTGTGAISHTHPVYGNPAFANPASDDYHLSPGSAAINTGDPAGVPPAPPEDADGVARPVGTAVDLGAYEWQGYWSHLPFVANSWRPAIGWAVGESADGYGTILRTTDSGATWVRQGSPADIPDTNLQEVSAVDAQHAWVVGGGAILRTGDGGLTWELQTLPPDMPAGFALHGVKALDANTVYVVGPPSVLLHTADGATWSQMAVGAAVPASLEFQTVDAVDASHIWAVGATEGRTDPVIAFYDGLEWGLQPTDVLTSPTSAVIGVSAIDQLHAWAVGGWGMPLAFTADGGASWQVSDHPLSGGDMNRVVAVSPTTGWTSGDYGEVLYTTDAGATWYDVSLPSAFLNGITALDDQTAWVVGPGVHGTAPGIIARTRDANHWEVQSDPSWPNMNGISFVGARR